MMPAVLADLPAEHDCFAERLSWLARHGGNRVALIDRDEPVTFERLDAEVRRLAAGLAGLGVAPGHRVAVWLPNCLAWVQVFLACAHLGAMVLAVNTRFRGQEVSDILGRGRADWLVMWPDFKGIAFDRILDDVPDAALAGLRGVVRVGGEAGSARIRGLPAHAYADLLASTETQTAPHGNAGVLCFTTSGTTSLPKFVLHDQRTLLRHGEALRQAYGYDEDSRILASAPFCGAFGFATLVGGLATGCTVVSEPVFEPAGALAQIRRHGVTHTYANNESIAKILALADGPEDFRRARLFGFASFSPAMDDLVERARVCGVPLTGLYGSSELIALVAAQPVTADEGDTGVRYQAGGRLVHPQARVRARDPETGRVLPHGEAGEIEILSPSLMQGYLDNAEATRRAMSEDGWFRTGDLGRTVSERQFVFLARMGDSLRLSGFLVNPAEIEQAVQALPGVRACQVVGASDGVHRVPYAFVLLEPGSQADPAAWRAACKRAMAGFKVPAGFTVLDAFPSVESANAVKIQKNKLRDMAEAILARAYAQG